MTKPGNGSKPKRKAKAAARKKQPKTKKPKTALKLKPNQIDGLLRRQAAEVEQRNIRSQTPIAEAQAEAGTFQVSFESLTISYPEPMFRDTPESRLLLATTRSRFMREMLTVYDKYAEAARNRYNEMDATVNRPPIQPMGLMLVDTTAMAATDAVPETEADDVPGDYVDDVAGAVV